MGNHCWPGGLEVLVEPDAGAGFRHDRASPCGLRVAEIVAVQFNQVERIEERWCRVGGNGCARSSPSALVAGDGLPIDDAGARAQSSQGKQSVMLAIASGRYH